MFKNNLTCFEFNLSILKLCANDRLRIAILQKFSGAFVGDFFKNYYYFIFIF